MTEPPASGAPRPVAATEEQAADSGLRAGIRTAARRAAPLPSSPHAEKFRLALGVLVVLAAGAVALAIIALQGNRVTHKQWSAFQPQFGGVAGARQIANYISPGYRIGSPSQQLAVVNVSSTLNGSTVVLKEGPSNNDTALLGGNTLVYTFCGLGPSCTIPGKPSIGRLDLVRLEAFQLTLYSLHYLHDIDNVVSILPPTLSTPASSTNGTSSLTTTPPASLSNSERVTAVEISRDQVSPLLSQPINTLFPARPPALGGVFSNQAVATMDYITSPDLYSPSSETASDGTQLLVLSQLPAQ